MGLNSLDDLEEFLSRQPSWIRKILEGDYSLATEEHVQMQHSDWPELLGQAQDTYQELLRKHPEKLRQYRKLQRKLAANSAVLTLPKLRTGRPRQDSLAQEAEELRRSGLSQPKIAHELNRRYPDRKNRTGKKNPFTAEAVRKILGRHKRRITPDKS